MTAMTPYQVTVRRRGVSPLTLTLLVGAASPAEASSLAEAIAERDCGGLFEPGRVRVSRARDLELDGIAA